jgi:hypothetical protein
LSNAVPPNTLAGSRRFVARPLWVAWVVPTSLAVIGGLPLLTLRWRPDILVVTGGILVVATVLAILLAASRLTVADGVLCVRHYSVRRLCLGLRGLRSVTAHPVRFGGGPALELIGVDGAGLRVRLGTWRHEEELLSILAAAAAQSGAQVDPEATEILRERPAPGLWAHRSAGRPTTALGRWLARMPRPLRWIATLGISLIAIVAIYAGLELGARLSEDVLFPRQIDPAWAERFPMADVKGDTWIGNLVPAGNRTVLASREEIQGFWGTIYVRGSADGGATWSARVQVSGDVDAARHTMVGGPDGSVVAAWAQRGPAPSTQRLVTRRSTDGGESWSAPNVVATPVGGLVGLPVLVVTDEVRLVAYTDGSTGQIWTQPLAEEGTADGDPVEIGTSSRQLYSDAEFDDGYLAMTSVGQRVVLSYVERNDRLRVMLSDDRGRTWRASEIEQLVYGGHPRLASDGATVLLAATDPNTSSRYAHRPFIRIWRSSDGGTTWERIPSGTDVADVGSLDVAWSGGIWQLVYEACPGFLGCATAPRIWYEESSDGRDWSNPSILSEPAEVTPIGVIGGHSGTSVVWARKIAEHDWQFQVSRRR